MGRWTNASVACTDLPMASAWSSLLMTSTCHRCKRVLARVGVCVRAHASVCASMCGVHVWVRVCFHLEYFFMHFHLETSLRTPSACLWSPPEPMGPFGLEPFGCRCDPPLLGCHGSCTVLLLLWSLQVEQYGAQPPIELLRQFMDHGGWYDLKDLSFRTLQVRLACVTAHVEGCFGGVHVYESVLRPGRGVGESGELRLLVKCRGHLGT